LIRRVIAPVLMIAALLLSGCSGEKAFERERQEARSRWQESESLSFKAEVCAELNEGVFECSLRCTFSSGETVIEILSPESIAGIKARIGEGETRLEYDGIILALGDPMLGESSPLAAMPTIMNSLLKGHVNYMWSETEDDLPLAVWEVYVDESSSMNLWFERENYTLMHAELVSGGRAVVKCKITDFSLS